MKKTFFYTKNNLKLAGIWHLPKKKTQKAIILAHGITVNKDENGIFINLATKLQEKGYAVFRFDFQGHGESDGKSIDMTIDSEIADLTSAINIVLKEGYKQIGLLGASFGGGISILFTEKNLNILTCLCLWNPVQNYDHSFLNPTSPWILAQKGHIIKDFQKKGWSTLGSRKMIIGKGLYESMSKYFPYIAMKNITLPTLILHGDKDTKVPIEESRTYVKNLKNGKLIEFPNSEHGFHVQPFYDQAIKYTVKFFKTYL